MAIHMACFSQTFTSWALKPVQECQLAWIFMALVLLPYQHTILRGPIKFSTILAPTSIPHIMV